MNFDQKSVFSYRKFIFLTKNSYFYSAFIFRIIIYALFIAFFHLYGSQVLEESGDRLEYYVLIEYKADIFKDLKLNCDLANLLVNGRRVENARFALSRNSSEEPDEDKKYNYKLVKKSK